MTNNEIEIKFLREALEKIIQMGYNSYPARATDTVLACIRVAEEALLDSKAKKKLSPAQRDLLLKASANEGDVYVAHGPLTRTLNALINTGLLASSGVSNWYTLTNRGWQICRGD